MIHKEHQELILEGRRSYSALFKPCTEPECRTRQGKECDRCYTRRVILHTFARTVHENVQNFYGDSPEVLDVEKHQLAENVTRELDKLSGLIKTKHLPKWWAWQTHIEDLLNERQP